jgi:hypothetical protein
MCRVETPSLGGSDIHMLALIRWLGKGQVHQHFKLTDYFKDYAR